MSGPNIPYGDGMEASDNHGAAHRAIVSDGIGGVALNGVAGSDEASSESAPFKGDGIPLEIEPSKG